MKKTMKRSLSFFVVLALALALLPMSVFAAATGGQVKGVTVEELGTAGTLASVVPGSVTLTAAQAADTTLTTAFTAAGSGTKIKKFASGATIDNPAWADDTENPVYANEALVDGDILVVEDIDEADFLKIVVSVTSDGGGDGGDDGSTGSKDVTGDGGTEYINLEIYDVTLPTDEEVLDFVLDPQGLLAVEEGKTVDLDKLEGGQIVSGSAPRVVNNSAVDVKLDITLTGTGDANFIAFDTDDETTKAKVEADTENNVLLYAVPSSTNIVNTTTEYAGAAKAYAITKVDSKLEFVLAAADYEVTKTEGKYVATAKANTGSGTAIQLGGLVNSKAKWAEYAGDTASKDVGVKAVFSFAKATTEQSETATVEGIPGMIAPTTGALTVAAAVTEPTATAALTKDGTEEVITLTAKGFTFASDATYTVTGYSARDSKDIVVTTAVVTGSGSSIAVKLNTSWSSGGSHQGSAVASYFIIENAGYSIKVAKPAANAGVLGEVTVTAKT